MNGYQDNEQKNSVRAGILLTHPDCALLNIKKECNGKLLPDIYTLSPDYMKFGLHCSIFEKFQNIVNKNSSQITTTEYSSPESTGYMQVICKINDIGINAVYSKILTNNGNGIVNGNNIARGLRKFRLNNPGDYGYAQGSEYYELLFGSKIGNQISENIVTNIIEEFKNTFTDGEVLKYNIKKKTEEKQRLLVPIRDLLSVIEEYILKKASETNDFDEFRDEKVLQIFANEIGIESSEKLAEQIILLREKVIFDGYKLYKQKKEEFNGLHR
ncbi:MAG: hypothetical protein HY769_07690 [Candidatus Stahlbacteria bacterium]|nr:hypothetical protein [Candidatus Stahlbacteria bacterium]